MKSENKMTLFAIPKPFVGHIGVIQRNALGSWIARVRVAGSFSWGMRMVLLKLLRNLE
jgi:hypothetical protein